MIHVYEDTVDGDVAVWLDPDDDDKTGLCIGCHETKAGALAQARQELEKAMAVVNSMLPSPEKPSEKSEKLRITK